MKNKYLHRFFVIVVLLISLVVSGLLNSDAKAQGGIRLRQPFAGTYRITAYVDHDKPFTTDSYMHFYTGEKYLNCPSADETWTTQGPYCYDRHSGTDYAHCDQPVLAAAPGKVTFSGWFDANFGETIIINHGGGYETRYNHLKSNSRLVVSNDTVIPGQQIATSGNTGVIPGTDPPVQQPCHLHFEVRYNGKVTDPFGWRGSETDPLKTAYGGETAVCLWGDGQCSETIVEDESTWFYKYGSGWDWYWTGNSWTLRRVANRSDAPDSAYARWRPDLAHEGPYSVFAFVPVLPAGQKTTNANYVVHDRAGDHSLSLNQSSFSERWVAFGNYDFWDSILGYMYLGNATGETAGSKQVVFDTGKFRQFRVYLPDVRNDGSWLTSLVMQNTTTNPAEVKITLYDQGGNPLPNPIELTIPARGQQVRWPNNTSVASAAIAASEDIAVEAENHNQGADVATNYTGISYPPHGYNPGWGQAATTLYEPTIKRDFFNATSDLHIMNVGSGATNVTIAYYNDSGTFQGSLACNLAPQAKCVKVANSAWGTLLNARITANQPLAVVNVERDAAGSPTRVATNHASANPTTFLYAPIYKKNWYSQNTSLHIRNTSSSQASVTVTYYDQDSSASYSDGPYLIPPNGVLRRWAPSVTALPVSFAGSAVIDSDKPIVARLYEQGEVRKMSNGTFVQGSQASYVPVACNTCGGWRSYIRVQNVGSAAAEVQVRYYDSGGNAVGNPETLSNLGVYRARNAASLPGGLDGSAVLTADQPIIVRVYLVYPDTSQDLSMTYDAPNR